MINIAKVLAVGKVFNESAVGKKLRLDAKDNISLGRSLLTIVCNPVAAKFIQNRLGGKKLQGRRIGLVLIE